MSNRKNLDVQLVEAAIASMLVNNLAARLDRARKTEGTTATDLADQVDALFRAIAGLVEARAAVVATRRAVSDYLPAPDAVQYALNEAAAHGAARYTE